MFEALLNGLYGGLPQGEDLLHSRTGEHLDMPAIDNVSMLRKETLDQYTPIDSREVILEIELVEVLDERSSSDVVPPGW